jgi:hypothetical protein
MRVWVNVWGTVTFRRLVAMGLATLVVGCIDDFDNPKGYGPRDSSGDTFGPSSKTCSELCEESATCFGGSDDDDCREQCSELTEVSRRAGCMDDFEEILDCLGGLRDACTQQEHCSQAAFHFQSCMESYCSTNPSDCPF